jgi:hypothetical protein
LGRRKASLLPIPVSCIGAHFRHAVQSVISAPERVVNNGWQMMSCDSPPIERMVGVSQTIAKERQLDDLQEAIRAYQETRRSRFIGR